MSFEPFSVDQLPRFALNWFTELGLPQAEQIVGDFITELERGGLTELARIPLMVTMLCQLLPEIRLNHSQPVGRKFTIASSGYSLVAVCMASISATQTTRLLSVCALNFAPYLSLMGRRVRPTC